VSGVIVGIDLGTTNSLIGAMDAGFPFLFADQNGRRLTPSIVAPTPKVTVGWEALESGRPVIRSVKRWIGEPSTPDGHDPVDLSARILQTLKQSAERALGHPVGRAVITVPAYFNDAQRSATLRAGERAGFHVERLLAEPTAAALAYGLDRLHEHAKIAVFDLGGGTFDISILELHAGVFEVLSTHGDTRLGGDDFDATIANALGIAPADAERIKRSPGSELARINTLCRPVLERARPLCARSLFDARLEPSALDEVILVGGSTRMPLVREFVREVFGREPNTSQHPDEAVALGAVIQAGILEGSIHAVTLLDVTPLSLGIETYGGLMNVLIPRNTTIPCKAGEMFTNAAAGQASMRINVLQGERELAKDNWQLGEFDIPFVPAPRGKVRVGVQFEIDANGILNVLARDTATGQDTTVKIRSAVEVNGGAVEDMLSASVEHAFEDMDDRIFVEACIKADEMLPAVQRAVDQIGNDMTPAEHEDIARLTAAIAKAREIRSTNQLKRALDELDRLTEPLAAKLVEKLMAL